MCAFLFGLASARATKRVTVGGKLKQLKARCRRGKLYSPR
jgi:hypothetical protein